MALSLNHPSTYPSREDVWPFDIAAQESIAIIDEFLDRSGNESNAFLGSSILNVNFPNVTSRSQIKGTKITQQGCSRFIEQYVENTASQGSRRCFTLSGEMKLIDTSVEYDTYAMDQGYIAITPLGLRCDHPDLSKFNNWFERK
jgi:broad specificity polyphosphatase/5'/3'-nucleotidase SurE